MPSFFKDLRRRSRASFKLEKSDSTSSGASGDPGRDHSPSVPGFTNGSAGDANTIATARSKSSSNLVNLVGSEDGSRYASGAKTPPRPPLAANGSSNRYSLVGSVHSSPRQTPYASPYAPRVTSVSDGSWVHQKVLLISGTIGDMQQQQQQQLDGQVAVCHHQDSFPATMWPTSCGHFKALLHLQPGPNRLRLDFLPSRKSSSGSLTPHSSWISINYLPLVASPPIHLVILVARDSPMTFDSPPSRVNTEGNGIETAIKKFRMAAYLWQAFTGEQMNRHGFSRRCFRFEEEWQPGTLSSRDRESGTMRNEAKIHIVRLDQSVAEVRDLQVAQQNENASKKADLFDMAMTAVGKHFNSSREQYVSCMFLDSQWDKSADTIRGHAALGGGAGNTRLAIFGSHALWSYPAHMEEVVPVFTDCTPTDTNFVANDCNESGSTWEAANIGIGAHMHETGHLLGCPHQENGVMLRDYVRLNRTFCCREGYSTRTNSDGMQPCLPQDECTWHRLDALRFRVHPCFKLPSDPATAADDGIQAWAVDNGIALITAAGGLAWIEIYVGDDELCHHWIEYVDALPNNNGTFPRQVTLSEAELRSKTGEPKKKLKIKIFSCGQGEHEIDDFGEFVAKAGRLKLPDGRAAFKGSKLGFSEFDGTREQQVILESSYIQTKLLLSVRVYSGYAFDGIEFVYEDGGRQLFGQRGGDAQEFALDTRRGETIIGYYVRAGVWIDGLQILTSTGRKSPVFGNKDGGSGYTLIPPRGYTAVGIYGTCGQWVDGFGLIISR